MMDQGHAYSACGCAQYDEWGNPQKPEFYEYMKSYSPVDNIYRTDYPNILVTAGGRFFAVPQNG